MGAQERLDTSEGLLGHDRRIVVRNRRERFACPLRALSLKQVWYVGADDGDVVEDFGDVRPLPIRRSSERLHLPSVEALRDAVLSNPLEGPLEDSTDNRSALWNEFDRVVHLHEPAGNLGREGLRRGSRSLRRPGLADTHALGVALALGAE